MAKKKNKNALVPAPQALSISTTNTSIAPWSSHRSISKREKKIVAKGNPVFLYQQGITATCGRFVYDTAKGRTELTENPEILSQDESGKVFKTAGENVYNKIP